MRLPGPPSACLGASGASGERRLRGFGAQSSASQCTSSQRPWRVPQGPRSCAAAWRMRRCIARSGEGRSAGLRPGCGSTTRATPWVPTDTPTLGPCNCRRPPTPSSTRCSMRSPQVCCNSLLVPLCTRQLPAAMHGHVQWLWRCCHPAGDPRRSSGPSWPQTWRFWLPRSGRWPAPWPATSPSGSRRPRRSLAGRRPSGATRAPARPSSSRAPC
mmetsp:Transcript_43697/g.139237  ORF Transcript_43697/g.139237 Transcript_43697/m.139237 type:complete len:214 (-) Transcript_43697:100-741(-)